MLKLVSWNMAHRAELWRALSDKWDAALLQEACEPPAAISKAVDVGDGPWLTNGIKKRRWRTAVVGLNPRVGVDRIPALSLSEAGDGDFGVTRLGTLAAANVEGPDTHKIYTLISMYALWEKPHHSTGSNWIFADASAHRLASDIPCLVGQEKGHRMIVAGDLNILNGYGEYGSQYWRARYNGVFDRFKAIGLNFVGPKYPNGRQANPWPSELPVESLNVPTYYTNRQSPLTATRQLDFVFASSDISDHIQVTALNYGEEWGGSDHCRIQIDID